MAVWYTLANFYLSRVDPEKAHAFALKALAKFDPFIAGMDLTLADCSAAVNLPLISTATKIVLGADALADIPQVRPYLKMLGERPAFARVNEDRKAAIEAAAKK